MGLHIGCIQMGMRDVSRRDVLSGVTATGALVLAGCVAQDDDGEDQSDGGPQIADTSVSSTGDSRSGESDAVQTFEINDNTVTVTGVLQAPNPCHEATLEDSAVSDDTLTLGIDVQETNDKEACVEMLGMVEYEITVELDDASSITTLTVNHATGDSHTLTQEEASEEMGNEDDDQAAAQPAIASSTIETTDARCGGTDDATVTRTADGFAIEGTIPTSNPCHEATLGEVTITSAGLEANVGTESTLEEGQACAQCIGEVAYRVDVTVDNADGIASVKVNHGGGEQYDISDFESESSE
jgi:hypothetical protein